MACVLPSNPACLIAYCDLAHLVLLAQTVWDLPCPFGGKMFAVCEMFAVCLLKEMQSSLTVPLELVVIKVQVFDVEACNHRAHGKSARWAGRLRTAATRTRPI
jgi:hypothetical protein